MKNLNVQDITHVSTNTSLKYVTIHAEVNGETVLITMHPALLFAASQQAMESFNYVLQNFGEEDGNEG